jgi:DNA-binding NarL/FixJ family response regulator
MIQQLSVDAAPLLDAPFSTGSPRQNRPDVEARPWSEAQTPAPTVDLDRPTRVLIVDDAPSTRRFLRGVLEYCPQFDVAGEADNGASAIVMADALQPDIVLLDVSMPVFDGSSALGGLLGVAPNARVIVLSGMDKSKAEALLAAGATAFVPKGLAPFELLDRLCGIVGRPVTVERTTPIARSPVDTSELVPQAAPRAVICDDDGMARRLVAQVLAKCDVPVIAETDVVPNLLAVIELARPELVLLDLWLEGTTGTHALPTIRRISPGTVVIVYSAHEDWMNKALAAGAAAFVTKPHCDELEAAVHRLAPMVSP